MGPTDDEIFELVREVANINGWRIEMSADHSVIRACRPDGTVAVQARKRDQYICEDCANTWAGDRSDHVCPSTEPS